MKKRISCLSCMAITMLVLIYVPLTSFAQSVSSLNFKLTINKYGGCNSSGWYIHCMNEAGEASQGSKFVTTSESTIGNPALIGKDLCLCIGFDANNRDTAACFKTETQDCFALKSFEFEMYANTGSVLARGYLDGVLVEGAVCEFAVTADRGTTVTLSGSAWECINEFRIFPQFGYNMICFYIDDILVSAPVTETTALETATTMPPAAEITTPETATTTETSTTTETTTTETSAFELTTDATATAETSAFEPTTDTTATAETSTALSTVSTAESSASGSDKPPQAPGTSAPPQVIIIPSMIPLATTATSATMTADTSSLLANTVQIREEENPTTGAIAITLLPACAAVIITLARRKK